MAYDGIRSYVTCSAAAQNVVATASGQVVTGSTITYLPVAEATFVVGIAAAVTATPTAPPSTVKYSILSGTTTVGTVSPLQTAGSSAYATVTPGVAVAAGSALQLQVIATGTASATETAGAVQLAVALAPQFV